MLKKDYQGTKTSKLHIEFANWKSIILLFMFDKRCNKEIYSISKLWAYIKDKTHLSKLQDKYYKRLINNGFKLERDEKNAGIKNIETKQSFLANSLINIYLI